MVLAHWTYTFFLMMCCTNPFVDSNIVRVTDWLKAAQSFMILALFTLPGALAIVAAYAFVAELEGNMKVLGAAMALTGIAGIYSNKQNVSDSVTLL